MTIWLLALLLVASLAGLGYRQGAIRVSFSLIGIFLGALLCVPLGKPMAILLKAFGVVHPVILWLVPPIIAFILISAIFKGIALAVHHKVEVHFRYKAGDLRLTLWERMNRRLGLCLGVMNGVAYLVVISFVIYVISYWTVQMEGSGESPKLVRLVTTAGKDLQSTGFIKTARALDDMPKNYYEAADIVGKLYQNPTTEARLSRYPAFLMLGERAEFQELAKDAEFIEMRARQDSVAQLLAHPPARAIVKNPDTLRMIWGIAEPNLDDLKSFLDTGLSPKYSEETILGRWNFNHRGTASAVRRLRPNLPAAGLMQERARLAMTYSKAKFVAGLDGKLVAKDYPDTKTPQAPGISQVVQTAEGQWTGAGENYSLTFTIAGTDLKHSVEIKNDRLTMTVDSKTHVVFEREY